MPTLSRVQTPVSLIDLKTLLTAVLPTSAAFHIFLARQEHFPSTRRSLLSFRSYLQRSLTLYGNNFSTTPIVCSIRYVQRHVGEDLPGGS